MKQKKTLHTISLVTVITLFAKLLGIARDALQARAFGTLAAADLFSSANNTTIYLFTTGAYALCVAAVPILTPRLRKNREEGFAAASNLLSVTVTVCLLAAVGWIGFTFLFPSSTGGLDLYIRAMVPSLPIIAAAYIFSGLFQSLDHFTLQGSMSIPYNVVLILFLVIVGAKLPMWVYAAATAAAWVLQLAMAAPYIIKEKYHFRFHIDLKADYMVPFLKTAAVTVLTTSVFLFCYLEDTAMAGGLPDGHISAFYYADKLYTPLTTTLIYSISAVLFPRFSQIYAAGDEEGYRRSIWDVLRSTLMVILPASAMMTVFGTPIVKVLFEGGSFDTLSTAVTGSIFSVYSLSMAAFCVLDLLSRAYYAMGRTLVPLGVNASILVINFGLNYFMGPALGGNGLAAATTISLTVGAILMAVLLLGKTQGIHLFPLVKLVLAAVVSGFALSALAGVVLNGNESKLFLVPECLLMGAVSAVVYAVILFVLRQEDLLNLIHRRKET